MGGDKSRPRKNTPTYTPARRKSSALGVPAVLSAGYDLYDTHGKTRLVLNYPTRAEAEYACACRNSQEGAEGNRLIGYG